jgi:tetratricopeptide (TPR) repeat protein
MSCDLELEITPGTAPGHYIITVDSPAGTASGQLRLDLEELLSRRRELASAVLASAVPTRSSLSAQELPVREVGRRLFEAVFAERIYGRYTASLQEAARQGQPLRVVLRLRAPELAGLPWEAMFDPEADEYLCQREPIVRYVETAQPATPLPVSPPLRILGIVSAPRDLPALDVPEEQRRLTDAIDDLTKRGQVELRWAPGGTWPRLQEVLQDGHWHVLHFIGHGGIDRGEGVLALEDELTGKANLVSSARFARLLHTCRPVPRLVVLNSCQSGEAAADDLLSSTAAALVHSGISAAVAMQFVVTDPAALAFSRGFYQALAHNHPVDEAVRLGRIMIDGTSENTLEWLTPVLFLRTDETRLFSIIRPEGNGVPSQPGPPPSEHVERESTLRGLYMQALAAMRTGRHAEAITLFDSLLALDPNYEDAVERRDTARRRQRLAASYERGLAAEAAGDWPSAIVEYTAITDTESDYRDAAQRLANCTRRQQVASLLEELRMHSRASEWEAVVAVGDELTALGVKSADVDRAIRTARQHIRRAEEASRTGSERPQKQSWTAQIIAVGGDRLRQDQSAEKAGARKPRAKPGSAGGKWKAFYAPHFPMLGSILITVPVLIVAANLSGMIAMNRSSSYGAVAMMILGLAGIAGAGIDYRNGCGVSAVAVGANSAWLSAYAILLVANIYQWLGNDIHLLILLICAVSGIGVIGNGALVIYTLRQFQNLRRWVIDISLLAFLVFVAVGLALISLTSALELTSPGDFSGLFHAASILFWAALLAVLIGIVVAFVRVIEARRAFLVP